MLCGGQLGQILHGCLKDTTVSDVYMVGGVGNHSTTDKGPILIFGNVVVVVCNSQKCSDTV